MHVPGWLKWIEMEQWPSGVKVTAASRLLAGLIVDGPPRTNQWADRDGRVICDGEYGGGEVDTGRKI